MDAEIDLGCLTREDLIEEYRNLSIRFLQFKEKCEEDAQRIYELKRSLETASAAEAYLAQELEQLSTQTSGDTSAKEVKLELNELRRKYKKLEGEHELLQQDYDAKVCETASLKEKLECATSKAADGSATIGADVHADCIERFSVIESDNMELLQKLDELRECNVQQTLTIAEKEKSIEILRDHVSCLEENLRSKRDEVEEKLQMLESAQDQLAEANCKIAMLTTAPTGERKGNSLFAEVDDQRQAMKQLLAAQKKSYLQMKKTYNESEYEIRRLKRENMAMHKELQICSTIFCNADRTYQEKLKGRISQLIKQNDNLERKLKWTQERLKDLANEKAVLWLDSMLNFCKQETDELKKELHSIRIHEASIEEELRNALQDMARWRFESLKSRCVLIDRENLLAEHKISFKPNHAMEFHIKENELQLARPRIFSVFKQEEDEKDESETPNKCTNLPKGIIELVDTPIKVEQMPKEAANGTLPVEEEPLPTAAAAEETVPPAAAAEVAVPPAAEEPVPVTIKSEPDTTHLLFADLKPQLKGTPVKMALLHVTTSEVINAGWDKCLTPEMLHSESKPFAENLMNCVPVPGTRSILCKTRDIFMEDSKKSVHFSTMSPVVHQLSPLLSDADNETSTAEGKENKPNVALETKDVRPKSKVTVRRIIVGKKQLLKRSD